MFSLDFFVVSGCIRKLCSALVDFCTDAEIVCNVTVHRISIIIIVYFKPEMRTSAVVKSAYSVL